MSVPFSVPPFKHDEREHELDNSDSGPSKQESLNDSILAGIGGGLFMIGLAVVSYIIDERGGSLVFLVLASMGFMIAINDISTNRLGKAKTSPLYVRYDSHNPPKSLEYKTQRRFLVAVTIVVLIAGCLIIVLWTKPLPYAWIDTMNPFFLLAHWRLGLAAKSFLGYLVFFLGLLVFLFFPISSFRFTSDRVTIFTRKILVRETKLLFDYAWDELEATDDSIMPKKESEQEEFYMPPNFVIDPCWLAYVARVMIQLPDASARQDFLDNLVDYAPPGTQVKYKRW